MNSLRTCADGTAILASARHPRCSTLLISGCGADCDLRCGSSGSVGVSGLRNFANGTSDLPWPPKRPAVPMARGVSRTVPLSPPPCPIPTSTPSAFLVWLVRASSTRRTAVYGPVRTVVSQGQRATAYLCQLRSLGGGLAEEHARFRHISAGIEAPDACPLHRNQCNISWIQQCITPPQSLWLHA